MKPTMKADLLPMLKLIIPLALVSITQSLTMFAETVFLAQLGTHVLSAGAISVWLLNTLYYICLGIISAINVMASHKHGAEDTAALSHIFRDSLVLAVLISIPVSILLWYIAPVFHYFNQSQEIIILISAYLKPIALSFLPMMLSLALSEFLISVGEANFVLKINILNVGLCIAFSYLLIFGKFGFPALSIAGAGWANLISYSIITLLLILYFIYKKFSHNYLSHLFDFRGKNYLLQLLSVGMPIGAMYACEVSFFFALTLLMGTLGGFWIVANQITMQYVGLFMSIVFAIAQAITVRMGHLLGSKNKEAAKTAAWIGTWVSFIFIVVIGLVYYLFPHYLISVDLDLNLAKNQPVIQHITTLLLIAALFQMLESVRISLFGALRALSDTHFTLMTSVISFWLIAIPVGYLLAKPLNFSGPGFWLGMTIGSTVSAWLIVRRFRNKMEHFVLSS